MTTKTKRVYDDPNHPRYGPVRRLWVILVGLGMLEAAEELYPPRVLSWDLSLCAILTYNDDDEPKAARWLVSAILLHQLQTGRT